MESGQIVRRVAKVALFLSLFVSLGIYSGIRNGEDTIVRDLKFLEIEEDVQVYRNNFGVPTIIANNLNDLAFVQGYEFARDRTFQLEMYHAFINAKLSTIFGLDLLEADVMIQSLNFKDIGIRAEAKLDQFYLNIVGAYVNGINQFFEQHEFNLPWEFQVLGIDPSKWEISDSLSMQAILAYYFNFDGFANELKRLTTIKTVGVSKSLDLFPIESDSARNSLLDSNTTYNVLETEYEDPFSTLFQKQEFQAVTGNNWVIKGSMTTSGNPIIGNQLNMRLSIPSFWYEVNLQLSNNNLNVQGYAIPGLPLILIGHNQDLAWGVGESNIDSVDLLFFKSNATHYFHEGIWKEFFVESYEFAIIGVPNIDRKIYKTEMGPILNISEGWYSIKWTLLENLTRDLMFQSLFMLNTATSIDDAHSALEYLTAPSINFILAEVSGGIGMQSTGLIPTREYNHGMIPENGSSYEIGWVDFVEYQSMNYVANGNTNYIVNGLQLANKTNDYYLYDSSTPSYQSIRLNQLLNNSDLNQQFELDEAEIIQSDIFNLAAKNILEPILNKLSLEINLLSLENLQPMIDELNSWNFLMDTESSAATIFETFRLFYNLEVYSDELSVSTANMLVNNNAYHLDNLLNSNQSDIWFDDITTLNKTENAIDLAIRALDSTYLYLSESLGTNVDNWRWGKLHQITFKHVMGNSAPFLGGLNKGPVGVNGSTFTINSFPDTLFKSDMEPSFEAFRGSSFKLVMEISSDWDHVQGLHAPGMSGHLTSDHYDDGYQDWIYLSYRDWMFNPLKIILTQEKTITYSHGDENG